MCIYVLKDSDAITFIADFKLVTFGMVANLQTQYRSENSLAASGTSQEWWSGLDECRDSRGEVEVEWSAERGAAKAAMNRCQRVGDAEALTARR